MKNNYWTITDPANTPTSELYKKMESMFPCWKPSTYTYDYLDKWFPIPKEPTTRYFLKSVEPDPETLGLSINQTLEKGITQEMGITLRERLIMEMDYFTETGKHLDVKGLTFCSGSRNADGFVPSVDLDCDGEVGVRWCSVDLCNSDFGIRVAVPLDTLPSDPLSDTTDKPLSLRVLELENENARLEKKNIEVTELAEQLLDRLTRP